VTAKFFETPFVALILFVFPLSKCGFFSDSWARGLGFALSRFFPVIFTSPPLFDTLFLSRDVKDLFLIRYPFVFPPCCLPFILVVEEPLGPYEK